jgi:hypothetical protein
MPAIVTTDDEVTEPDWRAARRRRRRNADMIDAFLAGVLTGVLISLLVFVVTLRTQAAPEPAPAPPVTRYAAK